MGASVGKWERKDERVDAGSKRNRQSVPICIGIKINKRASFAKEDRAGRFALAANRESEIDRLARPRASWSTGSKSCDMLRR